MNALALKEFFERVRIFCMYRYQDFRLEHADNSLEFERVAMPASMNMIQYDSKERELVLPPFKVEVGFFIERFACAKYAQGSRLWI